MTGYVNRQPLATWNHPMTLSQSFLRCSLAILLLQVVPFAGAQVFWELESPDGERSWLLGTMHSEDPRLLDFRPELLEAMGAGRVFAMELVPDAAMLAELNEAMHYDRNAGLDAVLDEALYARVVELLEDYGMGEPAVRRLRPWAAAMTLSVPPPETGLFMDLALSFRASGQGLEVKALETLEEQLDFLRGMSKDQQIEMIRQAVAEFANMPELFERLIGAYLEGDLPAMETMAEEQLAEVSPNLREHFIEVGLNQRNRVMLDRALPMTATGGAIIAVGALHLPGETGLIRGFREAGYDVRPVY